VRRLLLVPALALAVTAALTAPAGAGAGAGRGYQVQIYLGPDAPASARTQIAAILDSWRAKR
jgi:hypothetical protein